MKALCYLTVIPVPGEENNPISYSERSLAWFPLAGAVIGGLLLFLHSFIGFFFQPMLTTVLLLLLWISLTKGVSLTGFKESFCRIMKTRDRSSEEDQEKGHRYADMAVIVMILVLLVKLAALQELKWQFFSKTLILAPILGRWGMVIAASFFSEKQEGTEKTTWKERFINRELIIGTVTTFILTLLLSGIYAFFFLVVSGMTMVACSWGIKKTIGKVDEISWGAICEIGEISTLFSATLIMKMFLAGY